MKILNIKYIILSFVIAFISCDSLFEDELPKRDLAAENAIVDEKSAEGALLGAYSFLGANNGVFDQAYIVDNGIRSGLLIKTAGTYAADLKNFTVTDITMESKTKWIAGYQLINAANTVIYFVGKLDDALFTGNRKKEIIAEARFLRAFGHRFIMQYYAPFWNVNHKLGLLIRDVPASLPTNATSRSTMAQSYAHMIADLEYAMENAPDYTKCKTISKGAAKAFLADLLMIRGSEGDYERAVVLADEVLATGGFSKEVKFGDIFTKNYDSKEVIFSRDLATNFIELADNTSSSIKRVLGGTVSPYKPLHDEMKLNEKNRYENMFDSLMYQSVSVDKKQQVWRKVWRTSGDCPMYFMRLAQVYLIKAEAMARTNAPIEDVLAVLNILRKRATTTLYDEASTTIDREQLMQLIFNEYLYELLGENGTEWFICIRFNSPGGSRMLGVYNTSYVDDKQLTFPIIYEEMTNNPAMVDNEKF